MKTSHKSDESKLEKKGEVHKSGTYAYIMQFTIMLIYQFSNIYNKKF
jgi:predicted transcriptional regulator